MRRWLIALSCFAALRGTAQKAYFIDGYHGGIYGHIPKWQTRFMVDKLAEYPGWKINLELEPESWDTIAVNDPTAYADFKAAFADQSAAGRLEYVNPSYGQSYLYNVSGESMIRQFYYGMKKLRQHFPGAVFSTYSSEEPCFTSALPQVLQSYGFKYASLKNPNTCWGGYTRAFGGELVNWIGPDGSSILTVPRYEIEAFKPRSIWETIASSNSEEYIKAALNAGIRHPIGMCLQDAGWQYGPWLSRGQHYSPTEYQTWRGYFENVANKKAGKDWRFTQEDEQVGLMWGSQVLQRIAQQVRYSENRIVQAEKIAAMARVWKGASWPGESLEKAWQSLLLSEHHDCWIVPYNGKQGDTWIDKVVRWTGNTNRRADSIISQSERVLSGSGGWVRVYNTTGVRRREYVRYGDKLLNVDVPAMGYASYRLESAAVVSGASAVRLGDGRVEVTTDLYRIIVDPAKGGVITSWKANGVELVEAGRGINELRGNFYNNGGFRSSTETPATVEIVSSGPEEVKLVVKGLIVGSPFTEEMVLYRGKARVDFTLKIDWKENIAIGEYAESPKDHEVRKSYYDDRFKLLALFPFKLDSGKIYKNAPFDVLKSGLANTFFNRWDSLKNNVILNWVDLRDDKMGVALFSDHTTSYAHGDSIPLGLTVQYSGNGIFYRNYTINGPTEMHYALMPHKGQWDAAGLWTEGTKYNEPLICAMAAEGGSRSLLAPSEGVEVSSVIEASDGLLVRLFNAEGRGPTVRLTLGFLPASAKLVELDGRIVKPLTVHRVKGGAWVEMEIPRFGFKTIKFDHE